MPLVSETRAARTTRARYMLAGGGRQPEDRVLRGLYVAPPTEGRVSVEKLPGWLDGPVVPVPIIVLFHDEDGSLPTSCGRMKLCDDGTRGQRNPGLDLLVGFHGIW